MKEKKMMSVRILSFQPKKILLIGLTFFCCGMIFAQGNSAKQQQKEAEKFLVEAQKALGDNDFASAEAQYRKAVAKDPENAQAFYNFGNTYYNEERGKEALDRFLKVSEKTEDKALKHKAFHNLGNSFMKEKDYGNAVEAYKNALRNNPKDEETRYNLALAKQKQKEEQQQQDENEEENEQDQEDQDEEQESGDDKENEEGGDKEDKSDEGEDQDEDKENEQGKDEEEGDDEQKDQSQPDQKEDGENNAEEQQQPQQTEGKLSPQQIKNMLEAMENQEREVQDKINAEKAKGQKSNTEKDW